MSNAKTDFDRNITQLEGILQIYMYLKNKASRLNSDWILRSHLLLLVSAFDTYIHSIVIEKIMEQFFDSEKELNVEFAVPMKVVHGMRNISLHEKWERLSTYLGEELSKKSFQSKKSIEYAFSILKVKNCWSKIGTHMGEKPEDITRRLSLIIDRRNKIAHESDWNRIAMRYEQVNIEDIQECQIFVCRLVEAMERVINEDLLVS